MCFHCDTDSYVLVKWLISNGWRLLVQNRENVARPVCWQNMLSWQGAAKEEPLNCQTLCLNGWQSCCVRGSVCDEWERPSSLPASCAPRRTVIKIKAVVMGYSFWPRPVAYPFNGACVTGKKLPEPMREVDRKEIKIRGRWCLLRGFCPPLLGRKKEREEEETRGYLEHRFRLGRVRGPGVGGSPMKNTRTCTHADDGW